jgi:hypothetical protein
VRCLETGQPQTVTVGGRTLTVAPERIEDSQLTGTVSMANPSQRLKARLRGKAAKTRAAGAAWIWVEDHEILFPSRDFDQLPLATKVKELTRLTADVLADYPHIAGVVWSKTARMRPPHPADDACQIGDSAGYQRILPVDRIRQTVMVPGQFLIHEQIRLIDRVCQEEPTWLDWTLSRLQVPVDARSLLALPPTVPEPGSGLSAPSSGLARSSLYLPSRA